jgi:hypothetical protein
MSRRLVSYVHVAGQVFGPDDKVPAEYAAMIGDHAWVDDEAGAEDEVDDGSGDGRDGVPPRAGRGSGKEAWAAYAAEHEVEVADGASRDDIIAACEAAGVPVE